MKNLNVFLFFALCLFVFSSCETSDDFNPSGSSSDQSISPGTRLYTTSVDQFTWIRGNSIYASASENRLWSSKFSFGSGGDFTYSFKWDGSTYKLYGEYFKSNGNGYVFYGVKNTNNGYGSGTQIIVEGSIEAIGNGRYRVKMDYGSSATYAATVNNTQFFNQASKRFRTTMTMER